METFSWSQLLKKARRSSKKRRTDTQRPTRLPIGDTGRYIRPPKATRSSIQTGKGWRRTAKRLPHIPVTPAVIPMKLKPIPKGGPNPLKPLPGGGRDSRPAPKRPPDSGTKRRKRSR